MTKNKIQVDIIGIAVSGQTKNTLEYTYYFKRAGQKDIDILIESNKPQKLKDIETAYKKLKYGDSISNEELISVLNSLNKQFLHNQHMHH